MKLIFAHRPFKYFFIRGWWSLFRWKYPTNYPQSNRIYRLIDLGAISIGYSSEE
jgi:hypothetical protein